jgi:hypothetical protein
MFGSLTAVELLFDDFFASRTAQDLTQLRLAATERAIDGCMSVTAKHYLQSTKSQIRRGGTPRKATRQKNKI